MLRRLKSIFMKGTGGAAPSRDSTFRYKGYEIPVRLVNLTGGGPDTFDAISRAHIANLERHVGIPVAGSIVEIGCGIGRDAIPLTACLSDKGQYLGIDIIRESIDWCRDNIGARHPNFRFVHFDVKDQLHNPAGTAACATIRIPVPDQSVDRFILQSVFTHLMAPDIEHYLREFRRTLADGGLVWATCFVVDDAIRRSAQATDLTPFKLRFEHEHGDGCFINDPAHPTGAVAYTHERLEELCHRNGMELDRPLLRGAWSGFFPDAADGQDVAILRPSR